MILRALFILLICVGLPTFAATDLSKNSTIISAAESQATVIDSSGQIDISQNSLKNTTRSSFNCVSKKLSVVENLICSSEVTSDLDINLSHQYLSYLKSSTSKKKLKIDQKNWIKIRNQCENSDCLNQRYIYRRVQLAVQKIEEESLINQVNKKLSTKFWATRITNTYLLYTMQLGPVTCGSAESIFGKSNAFFIFFGDIKKPKAYFRLVGDDTVSKFSSQPYDVNIDKNYTWLNLHKPLGMIDIGNEISTNIKNLDDKAMTLQLWATSSQSKDHEASVTDTISIAEHCLEELKYFSIN